MLRSRFLVVAVLLGFALIAGCSGSQMISSGGAGAGSSQLSLTMTDTPPANVAIISVEVNVTGAVVNPGNIDLLAGKGPVQVEIKRLEVETAFISTAGLPAGSGPFTNLVLAFANPELTFQNISNAPVTFGNCVNVPPQGVCELKPTGTLTTTVTFSPPLSVPSGSNTGLKVDVNLTNLITSTMGVDFSATGAVTVTTSQLKAEGELEDIDDVFGTVQNKGTNTFDLATSEGPVLRGIQVDNNTVFEDFAGCTANPPNFSCVQNDQRVEVDLKLMPAGVLLARKVEQENEAAKEEDIEGIVFSVNTTNNTFQMVAVENASSLPASVLGSPITISAPPATTQFKVDTDGLNVSATLVNSFNSISALQPGQNIQVRRITGDGSATTPIVTDRVRLRMSRFTATVSSAPSAGNFNVTPLAGSLLAAAGVATIQVQTSSRTQFEGVSVVSNLNVNDTVSLRGLLFKQPGTPVLVAGKVRKR